MANKYLDYAGLGYFIGRLKARAVGGLGLSANDYSDDEKQKLAQVVTKLEGLEAVITGTDSDKIFNKLGEVFAFLTDISSDAKLSALLAGKADASALDNYLTKTAATGLYQPKGNYLTEHQALPTALPNPSSLIVKLNGGATEGTNMFTYSGSAAKTINITPASIGAATAAHTHSEYLTEHQSLEGYMKTTDIIAISNTEIDALLA